MINTYKHKPLGKGIGINPGRVVWIYSREALDWLPENGYWWKLNNFDEQKILSMIREGIIALTNEDTIDKAWRQLVLDHNLRNKINHGFLEDQKIAIKVNINGSGEWSDDYSGNSHMSYTNPVLLKALLTSLVEDLKVKPENITIFDAARIFPHYFVSYCTEDELKGIRFEGRNEAEPDYNAPVIWSKYFSDAKNYFPKCVTQADYLINLANLKGHFWGVTLLAKNHFGTIINSNRMRPPEEARLHSFLIHPNKGDYSPLVDLFSNKELYEKTFLYMLDALICTDTEGTNITRENSKWYLEPFNGDYTKSIFFSQDPIALESVGFDFLRNEPNIRENNTYIKREKNIENYIHEAASIDNPLSKTTYLNGRGEEVENLGVHEHWNNAKEKKYSRNLNKNYGIDLYYLKI